MKDLLPLYVGDFKNGDSNCRGGTPWPPPIAKKKFSRIFCSQARGGHGVPTLQLFSLRSLSGVAFAFPFAQGLNTRLKLSAV